jgi:transposase InsO family protein
MTRLTDAGAATVSLLCATFSISRAAYYEACKPAAERTGKVVRLPTAPRYTTAEVVLTKIREVIAREGSEAWGVRKVWATLRREGLRVSRKRVWALMHAHGLVMARDREPGETARGHVAVPEPNRRIATDLTTTWTKRDGVVAIVPTIDCGCRSMLGMVVTKDQHGPAVLESVQQALRAAFSSPAHVPEGVELRTDHGPQYTGADCAQLVDQWGLEHTYAPVGRPTGNAVVERVIRTLKEEVVWLRDWESIDELRAAIMVWVKRYNEQRPHQALAWKTPAEYRAEHLGTSRLAVAA